MDEALDDSLCEVLERIESGGSVSTQWLQARYPSSWRDLRGALALDRDLAPEAVPVERIAGVRLGDWIGSGAMGVVFEGTPEDAGDARRMPSRVAVKILHPEFAAGPGFTERLAREIEIGRGVVHANLVRTLAAGFEASGGRDRAYLVMEYAEGQTLRALLDEHGRVPETMCRRIGLELAEALAALHAAGAVHRDVKPENVILGADGFVKLMDYGVAFVAEESSRGPAGGFVGTVLYAAPEQFARAGARIDGRTDLYALGVVLHELATGVHPFAAKDARTSLELRMEGPPPASRDFPDVSPFLEAAIARLLDPDADRRFASAREFADTLSGGEGSAWWRRTSAELGAARHGLRRVVRVSREAAVAGREPELAALRDLFAGARGGTGACVLVVGEAGVGKSRLVDEFAVRLAADGEDFHFLYGSYSPDAVSAGGGAFSAALRGHFGDAALEDALTPRLGALAPLVPAFAAMLRGSVARDASPLSREAVPTLFLETLRSLARERTTVLVVDDLHFAPDDARDLLRDLARAVGGDRVLVVASSRPEAIPERLDALAAAGGVHRIDLGRLRDGDVELIVTDALGGGAASEEIAGEVARRCDGNPLLALGVLQGLRDDGAVTRGLSGAWRFDRSRAGASVPAEIRELVRARLAGLGAADRELLDVAACAGFEFDATLAGEALGAGPLAVLRRFARVEASTRLVRSSGALFRFDHHLAHETVYADLDAASRARHHGALAAAIERRGAGASPDAADDRNVALCRHWLRAGDAAKAGPLVIAAIDRLADRYEHESAIGLANEALAEPEFLPIGVRIDVLLRKSELSALVGRAAVAEAVARQAMMLAELGATPERRVESMRAVAQAALSLARFPEAVSTFEAAAALCPPDAPELRLRIEERLAKALLAASRFEEARSLGEVVVGASAACGDTVTEARACLTLAAVERVFDRLAACRAWAERAIAGGRRAGRRDIEGQGLTYLGRIRMGSGEFEDALCSFRQAHVVVSSTGDRNAIGFSHYLMAGVHLYLGQPVSARQESERALAIFLETGAREHEAGARAYLAAVADFTGDCASALRESRRVVEIARDLGDLGRLSIALGNESVTLAGLGAFEESEVALRESLDVSRRLGLARMVSRCEGALADLAKNRGDFEQAEIVYRRLLAGRVGTWTSNQLSHAEELARVLDRTGRTGESAEILQSLVEPTSASGLSDHRVFVLAYLAVLGVVAADAAETFYGECCPKLRHATHLDVRLLLWRATGSHVHLAEAHRLLQHLRRHAPVEYRDSMVVNHPLYRAVDEAWKRHGS